MKKIILPELPENLSNLHLEEEKIRTNSLLNLNSSKEQRKNIDLLQNTLNILFDITIEHEHGSDNEWTIQKLGLRLYNTISASFKLLLSGYYQTAFSQQRDILEILFLLDYFNAFPDKIDEWKSASNANRIKNFSPGAIRKALDKRDGFVDKKRERHYKMFCEYAAHPSFIGIIKLTTPTGKTTNQIGPFFDEKLLINCFFELVKLSQYAIVIYLSLFDVPAKYLPQKLSFLNDSKAWFYQYKNKL